MSDLDNSRPWLDALKWDGDGMIPAIAQDEGGAPFDEGMFIAHDLATHRDLVAGLDGLPGHVNRRGLPVGCGFDHGGQRGTRTGFRRIHIHGAGFLTGGRGNRGKEQGGVFHFLHDGGWG